MTKQNKALYLKSYIDQKVREKIKELRLEVEGGWKVECGKGRVRPLPYQAEKEREVIILTL